MRKGAKLEVARIGPAGDGLRSLEQRCLCWQSKLYLLPFRPTHTLTTRSETRKPRRPSDMLPESVLKSAHCRVVGKFLFLRRLSAFGRAKARVLVLDVAAGWVDHIEVKMWMRFVGVLDHGAKILTEFKLKPFHCALLPISVFDAIARVGRHTS